MVLKRFKLHQFFNGVARTLSYTQAWVSERGKEFDNVKNKSCYLILSGKKQISLLFSPLRKLLEKSTSVPPGKNPSDAHGHKHVK